MSPNEALVRLRQIAEGFLADTQTAAALDVAMQEAMVAGCAMDVIRHTCEIALDRIVADLRAASSPHERTTP